MSPLLLRPLGIRRVGLLWGGLTLSAVGDQLYAVALVWVAVGVFGPAAGYLSALQAACGMLAALLAGRWADRWDQRRAMAGADGVRAAVLLGLVGLVAGRGAARRRWRSRVAIVVLAAGEAVFRPALAATLPGLLPDRALLPAANALFDTTERSARLLGPGLVGVLAGALPVVHFFSLDAATFLLSALAILRLGPRASRHAPPPARLLAGQHRARLRGGAAAPAAMVGAAGSGPINGLWVGRVLPGPAAADRARRHHRGQVAPGWVPTGW